MDSELKTAKKILFSCRSQIAHLEKQIQEEEDRDTLLGFSTPPSARSTMLSEQQLQDNIDKLNSCLNNLQMVIPSKDNSWRHQVDQIIAEKDSIQNSLKKCVKKRKQKEKGGFNGFAKNDLDIEDPVTHRIEGARSRVRELQDVANNVLNGLVSQNQMLMVSFLFFFHLFSFSLLFFHFSFHFTSLLHF